MADLNKLMADIQDESDKIKERLKSLSVKYETLYKDGNKQFLQERISSNGSMEGLEDFRRLVLILKRNRDVVGSLVRGMNNLKSVKDFKFIEESVPPPRIGTKKQKKRESKVSEDMEFESMMSDVIDVPEPIESEMAESDMKESETTIPEEN